MSQPGGNPDPAAKNPAVTAGKSLLLPRSLADGIVTHARQEAPRECCGLIAGQPGHLEEIHRLTNLAPGNRLYEIDSKEVYELEFRTLPARNQEVVAIYHSHPVTEAYPSATDQSQAFWPDVYYLICSLDVPDAPVIRAFRLGGDEVVEVPVEIGQDEPVP